MDPSKLILDFGSSEFRLGVAGDVLPDRRRSTSQRFSELLVATFLGEENLALSKTKGVVLIEKNDFEPKNREIIAKILFEKYKIPSLLIVKNAPMRLYAAGKSSGQILEFSETRLEMVTVEDGYVDQQQMVQSSFSLAEKWGENLVQNREKMAESAARGDLELPDGLKVSLDEYRAVCGSLIRDFQGPKHFERRELVLGGRGLMHQGFLNALSQTVGNRFVFNEKSENKDFLENGAFIGASIVGVVDDLNPLFTTRAEWEEGGMTLLNKQFQ